MRGRKVQFWMGTSFILVLLLISLFYLVYTTYSNSNSNINQNMVVEQMRFQAESVFDTLSSTLGTKIVGFVYGDNSKVECSVKMYSGFDPSQELVSYDRLLSTIYEENYPISMNHSFKDLINDVVGRGRYSRYSYPDYTYFVREYNYDRFKVDNKDVESYYINLSFVGGIDSVSLEPNTHGTIPLNIYGPNGFHQQYYIDDNTHYKVVVENEFGLIKSPLYIDIDGEDSQETTFDYSEVRGNSSECDRSDCTSSAGMYNVWARRNILELWTRFNGLGSNKRCESELIKVEVYDGSDSIGVTLSSGRESDKFVVKDGGVAYSRLGFGVRIVEREGDIYLIELSSPCNAEPLDSVEFNFGSGSRVVSPTSGIIYTRRECCTTPENLFNGIDMDLVVELPFYGNIFKIPSNYDNTMVNLSYGALTVNRRFE